MAVASRSCSSSADSVSQVVKNSGEVHLTVDHHLANRQADWEDLTVAPNGLDVATDADDAPLASVQMAGEVAIVAAAIRLRHQQADVRSDDFGFGIAEQPLGSTVEDFDAAVRYR